MAVPLGEKGEPRQLALHKLHISTIRDLTADQTKGDGVRNSSITLAAANAIQDKLGVEQYRIITLTRKY